MTLKASSKTGAAAAAGKASNETDKPRDNLAKGAYMGGSLKLCNNITIRSET
ncbi:hypothetical protein D3C80_1785260 [compost metagenome]